MALRMFDLGAELFSLLLAMVSMISFVLGVYILVHHPRHPNNRNFFIFAMLGSYWASLSFMRTLVIPIEDAALLMHLVFLWPFAIIALVVFLLVFIQSEELLNTTYMRLLLYVPALIASFFWLFGNIEEYLVLKSWGWKIEISISNPIVVLIGVWQIIIGIICLKTSIQYYLSLTNQIEKQKTFVVLIAIFITVIAAIFSEIGFRLFSIELPPLTVLGFGLTCMVLAYSMVKYDLFLITPETAAKNILGKMTESVIFIDNTCRIQSINKSALELLRYDGEEDLLGNNINRILPEVSEEYSSIEDLIKKYQLKDKIEKEMLLSASNGAQIPVLVSISLIQEIYSSEINGMIWLFHDITELKKAEEERVKAEEIRKDLEQKRLSFLEMTSHELRTPLTAILGYSSFIEMEIQRREEKMLAKPITILRRNALRLQRLIDGVMDISQIEDQQFEIYPQNVDFRDVLNDSLSIYKKELEDSLIVDIKSPNSPILTSLDSDRINQVLTNLMENAIKNSPKDNIQIRIEVERKDEILTVTIRDRGAGIDPENLEKIFQKYVSLPSKYSVIGSGIGLYISRMIVEAHGGSLTAESEGTDKGAVFTLILPIRS